jgi:hypothetical protein
MEILSSPALFSQLSGDSRCFLGRSFFSPPLPVACSILTEHTVDYLVSSMTADLRKMILKKNFRGSAAILMPIW